MIGIVCAFFHTEGKGFYSIPEESYEFDASEEKYDDPNAYDEQYEEYEAMTHDQLVKKCIDLEWVAGDLQDISDSRLQDIKMLLDLLEQHKIQVPEDVEKRFLAWITPYNKPEDTSSESTSSKEIVDNSMADDAWAAIEEELNSHARLACYTMNKTGVASGSFS